MNVLYVPHRPDGIEKAFNREKWVFTVTQTLRKLLNWSYELEGFHHINQIGWSGFWQGQFLPIGTWIFPPSILGFDKILGWSPLVRVPNKWIDEHVILKCGRPTGDVLMSSQVWWQQWTVAPSMIEMQNLEGGSLLIILSPLPKK